MPSHSSAVIVGSLLKSAVAFAVGVSQTYVTPAPRLRYPVPTGRGRVVGTTKLKGVPVNVPTAAKVRLYADRSGVFVQQTDSNPSTGEYEFTGVDEGQTYTVVAIDPDANYRAVVADRVNPELMP